jgi:hypothetical protein
MVAFEDDGERVRVACPYLLDQALIAQIHEFRIGCAVAPISERPPLDTYGLTRLCTVFHAKSEKYNWKIIFS